jgi:hypothetical protein
MSHLEIIQSVLFVANVSEECPASIYYPECGMGYFSFTLESTYDSVCCRYLEDHNILAIFKLHGKTLG